MALGRFRGVILAHRGQTTTSSNENVISQMDLLPNWVTAIECDCRHTSDGVPMLMHDSTVDRTTNGTGAINSLTLAQVKNLDAGSGEQVPTLAEWLSACEGRGYRYIVVDFKDDSQAQVDINLAVFDAASSAVRNALCINGGASQMFSLAPKVRQTTNNYRFAPGTTTTENVESLIALYDKNQPGRHHALIAPGKYIANRAAVTTLRSAGYGTGTSTQNDFDNIESAAQDQVDMILTDQANNLAYLFADYPLNRIGPNGWQPMGPRIKDGQSWGLPVPVLSVSSAGWL